MGHFLADHPSTPLTHEVIGAAITVHRHFGPGLFESVYRSSLAAELRHLGHVVAEEVGVRLVYRGIRLGHGFRMDLLVDDELIVEVKAAEKISPAHRAQMLTYLRLAGRSAGLILNFHAPYLGNGAIKRILLDS